jgi:hypothetical protein
MPIVFDSHQVEKRKLKRIKNGKKKVIPDNQSCSKILILLSGSYVVHQKSRLSTRRVNLCIKAQHPYSNTQHIRSLERDTLTPDTTCKCIKYIHIRVHGQREPKRPASVDPS